MIASDKKAIRIGSAFLVVDGSDNTLDRKAQFSLVPGRVKARRLSKLVSLSAEVYNAAIEHRRGAYKRAGVTIRRFDQFNEIPAVRISRPDVASVGNQFVRGSISRADEAFTTFFRRVGDGEKPGFPRFKSPKRFRTAFYDEANGWAVRRLDQDTPALYVQGVGEIELSMSAAAQLRRLTDRGGEARTLTLAKLTSGAWRATIGFRHVSAVPLAPSIQVGGVDRGIAVTAALSDGTLRTMPGFLREARDEIAALQRQRQQHTTFGPEWKRLNRRIAKAHKSAHNQSENGARHTAIEIVARNGVIAIEKLKLANMTTSARGTKEAPGTGGAAKQGLNRSLQDAALGRLAYWICVKAEEAGRRVYKVDPRDTSRQCVACGHTDRANRCRTRFECKKCGHQEHADVNAAQVIAARGMVAETSWIAAESPKLKRPVPRNLRRKGQDSVKDAAQIDGAGSAPYARAA